MAWEDRGGPARQTANIAAAVARYEALGYSREHALQAAAMERGERMQRRRITSAAVSSAAASISASTAAAAAAQGNTFHQLQMQTEVRGINSRLRSIDNTLQSGGGGYGSSYRGPRW